MLGRDRRCPGWESARAAPALEQPPSVGGACSRSRRSGIRSSRTFAVTGTRLPRRRSRRRARFARARAGRREPPTAAGRTPDTGPRRSRRRPASRRGRSAVEPSPASLMPPRFENPRRGGEDLHGGAHPAVDSDRLAADVGSVVGDQGKPPRRRSPPPSRCAALAPNRRSPAPVLPGRGWRRSSCGSSGS